MFQTPIAAIIAFASTNIDDVFILMLFFSDKRYKTKDIFIGQYLGIITLISISMSALLIGNFIENRYIGLLGLFPMYVGIRKMLSHNRDEPKKNVLKNDTHRNAVLTVALVTIANGGDNVGTYIPLFTSLDPMNLTVMIGIFLAMVFIWLLIARYLSEHPHIAKTIGRYGHIITPIVLVLVGIYILYENGSFALFSGV